MSDVRLVCFSFFLILFRQHISKIYITFILCLCGSFSRICLVCHLIYLYSWRPDEENITTMSNLGTTSNIVPDHLVVITTTPHHGPCCDLTRVWCLTNRNIGVVFRITILWLIIFLSAHLWMKILILLFHIWALPMICVFTSYPLFVLFGCLLINIIW